MKRIILDTNILMAVAQFKLDIFTEIDRICLFNYQLCVIDKTIGELKKIQEQDGKQKRAAKLALSMIISKRIKKINSDKNADVDSIILSIANSDKDIVATQDKLLKGKLREKNIPVITMRQRKYLVLEE